MVLIHISLMMSEVEHLFIYLLVICILSLEKMSIEKNIYCLVFIIELCGFCIFFGY